MTYEYECTCKSCNHRWECQQKITEDAFKICPACKKETAKRLISGGVSRKGILKGGGWFNSPGGY